jgi:hypothetical protein
VDILVLAAVIVTAVTILVMLAGRCSWCDHALSEHYDWLTLTVYAERWLQIAKPELAPATLSSYTANLERHLKPALGGMKVRAIHRGHIKALLAEKAKAGLSRNSLRLIRATLSVILGDAVEDGVIPINPAAGSGRRGRKRADSCADA